MSPVIENAFLSLPQSVDVFPLLPAEGKFCAVCPVIRHRTQVVHEIAVTVHGVHSADLRCFPAGRPHLHIEGRQFLVSLLQKQRAACILRLSRVLCLWVRTDLHVNRALPGKISVMRII